MIASLGWRTSYPGAAALSLLVVLCFRPPPENPPTPAAAGSLPDRLKSLFRERTFLLLLAAFTLCGFTTAVYCPDLRLHPRRRLRRLRGSRTGVVLFSADRVHRPRLLASMFFSRALAFVVLPFVATLFLFAALFGVLNFATFPVIANIVATRLAGLTLGLPFGGHSLGAGVLLGDLRPRDGLWWIALAALAGVFALLVPERRAVAAA